MEHTNLPASSDLHLAGIFRERPPGEEDAALGGALRRLFEEGERAWPGVSVAPEAFVRHLAARAPEPTACGARELPSSERARDLFLACACAACGKGAIEAFDRVHLRPVGAYLARMRPSAAFVDEVKQALREKLFVGREGAKPKIVEYDGRGALSSWVRVMALRAAIDLRRESPDVAPLPRERAKNPAPADLETGYLQQRYREAFNAAFRGALAALDREQRELFRLHFVDGLTLDQLAARAGVHRATIARKIAAAREVVADEARRLLGEALGASEAELASLAGVMRSQIELSLAGALRDG